MHISWCTRWARFRPQPHAEKLLSTIRYTLLVEIWKNLMPRSFTFVSQLYYCSSKHNNNKALRITFNSCKTISTSSMALATVNIDKIIKELTAFWISVKNWLVLVTCLYIVVTYICAAIVCGLYATNLWSWSDAPLSQRVDCWCTCT